MIFLKTVDENFWPKWKSRLRAKSGNFDKKIKFWQQKFNVVIKTPKKSDSTSANNFKLSIQLTNI